MQLIDVPRKRLRPSEAGAGAWPRTKDSLRLFMVPGIAHCGGEGPNQFDTVAALDQVCDGHRSRSV